MPAGTAATKGTYSRIRIRVPTSNLLNMRRRGENQILPESQASHVGKLPKCALQVFEPDVPADPPTRGGLKNAEVAAAWADVVAIARHKTSLSRPMRGEGLKCIRCDFGHLVHDLRKDLGQR